MKKFCAAALMFFVFLLPAFLGSQENEESSGSTVCCFIRDGYQGQCRVTPGEGETCESILEYLNTPGTVGKTYCKNSRFRGGWSQVDCSEE
jgi:hypothetical protein